MWLVPATARLLGPVAPACHPRIMRARRNLNVAAPELLIGSLTAWCGECDAETEFDKVPGGMGVEFACRECSAAVFNGDLPLIESIFQPIAV